MIKPICHGREMTFIARWQDSVDYTTYDDFVCDKCLRIEAVEVDPTLEAEIDEYSEHGKHQLQSVKPKIVCLCGSTRFSAAYQRANLEETLAGNIVLTIGCDMRADTELFADKTPEELEQIKAQLDELHLRKIDLADEVLILNIDGYIGSSTSRELAYAESHGKRVRFLVAR